MIMQFCNGRKEAETHASALTKQHVGPCKRHNCHVTLTLYGHIKTAQQRTIIQKYSI